MLTTLPLSFYFRLLSSREYLGSHLLLRKKKVLGMGFFPFTSSFKQTKSKNLSFKSKMGLVMVGQPLIPSTEEAETEGSL